MLDEDRRYTLRLEGSRFADRKWVARFEGSWIGSHPVRSEAARFITKHRRKQQYKEPA